MSEPTSAARDERTRLLLWGAPVSALLLVAGALIGGGLQDGYDRWTQELSDLGALTADSAWVWNASSWASGIALLCCAVGLWRAIGDRLSGRATALLVAVVGAGTVLDGFLREDCPASTDPACMAREEAGLLSWHHQAHVVESTIVVLAMIAAPLAIANAPSLAERRARRLSAIAAVTIIVCFTAYLGVQGEGGAGGLQRAGVAAYLIWLTVFALSRGRSKNPADG